MLKRIGLWAFAGGGVAIGWAFFATAAAYFGHSFDFYHWIVLRLTFPLAWFGLMRISCYEAIFLNAAAYALIGVVTEPFWRHP